MRVEAVEGVEEIKRKQKRVKKRSMVRREKNIRTIFHLSKGTNHLMGWTDA